MILAFWGAAVVGSQDYKPHLFRGDGSSELDKLLIRKNRWYKQTLFYYNHNNNNNMWIYKAHNVSTQAESEAPAVARWGWWGGKVKS